MSASLYSCREPSVTIAVAVSAPITAAGTPLVCIQA
jgi:hypothetical protein